MSLESILGTFPSKFLLKTLCGKEIGGGREMEAAKKHFKSIQVLLLSELKKGSLFTTVSIQIFTLCFCLKQVTETLLKLPYCRRRNTALKWFVMCQTKPRRIIRNQITELETSLSFQSKVYCFEKNSRELLVITCTKNSNYKILRDVWNIE